RRPRSARPSRLRRLRRGRRAGRREPGHREGPALRRRRPGDRGLPPRAARRTRMTETATASGPAEPDIAPVPDLRGHFVVGAVGVAEEGGAGEAPGVAYGGRFAPEALMAALDELTAA